MEHSPDLVDFSKDNFQADRDQAASEIYEKRTAYFNKQKEADVNTDSANSELIERQRSIEAISETISGLETFLAQRENSVFLRILDFLTQSKQITESKAELENNQSEQQLLISQVEDLKRDLCQLEAIKTDQQELTEAKNILSGFWSEVSNRWEGYEHEKEVRDIRNVMRKHDCFFVHAMVDKKNGQNSWLLPGVTWEVQAMIDSVLRPQLSTSTFSANQTRENVYCGNCGIILSGGIVAGASESDSHPLSHTLTVPLNNEDSEVRIDQSIKDRRTSVNEFRVQQSEVGAIFYSPVPDIKWRPIARQRVEALAEKLGVPVYIISDGGFYKYRVEEIDDKSEIVLTDKITVNEFLNLEIAPPEKDALLEEIIEASPFEGQYYKKDGRNYSHWSGGRTRYLTHLRDNNESVLQKKVSALTEDEMAIMMNEYEKDSIIGKRNDKIFEIIQNFHFTTVAGQDNYGNPYIVSYSYYCASGEWKVTSDSPGRLCQTIDREVSRAIEDYKAYLAKDERAFAEESIYRLLGIAYEAMKYGDDKTYNQIIQAIPKDFDMQDYQALLQKRVDENGLFIRYKSDFKIDNSIYGYGITKQLNSSNLVTKYRD